MKLAFAFLAGAGLVLFIGAGTPGTSASRFVLHSAKEDSMLFKLDTVTGQTWVWVDVLIDGHVMSGWEACKGIDEILTQRPTTKPTTGK